MMKYEPTSRQGVSFYEILMQPFIDDDMSAPVDWALIDLVKTVYDTLDTKDKEILNEIYFQQNTYETAKKTLASKPNLTHGEKPVMRWKILKKS